MHTHLNQLPPAAARHWLADVGHETPLVALESTRLSSGEAVTVKATDEAVLLLLQGEGITSTGEHLQAPAVVRAVDAPHVLKATQEAHVLVTHVDVPAGISGAMDADSLRPTDLTWRDSIHGGEGRIATRHVWRPEDFAGDAWVYVDHAILGSDSSLGHHYHEAGEEIFYVLAGQGWMTIGDDTFEIGPGSLTYHPPLVGHGLYNPHDAELDFLRLAIGVPGEEFTTIDVEDDLRRRRPGGKP